MKWTTIVFFSVICCSALGQMSSPVFQQGVQRYAVIVGANNGGQERIQLRYASTDALAIASVFSSLGGLKSNQQRILIEPKSDEILLAIQETQNQIEEDLLTLKQENKAPRIEFIFYYSGHSNEKNLLVGEETLPYDQLKEAINSVKADVHVAILDSCASGAFTRLKGGQHVKPFLANNPSQVNGYAYLTSSSSDEAAQESDAIGGAFFTHYLVSALRGAGDLSQDRRITLNEAYHFAFNETLARTEGSQHGPQHPAYDIQLSGEGDLVLTDLTDTSAELILENKLLGRVYIRDSNQRLVIELNKQELKAIKLGLEPGDYSITVDKDGQIFKLNELKISTGSRVLKASDLEQVSAGKGFAKGSSDPNNIKTIGIKASFFPQVTTHKTEDGTKHRVKLDLNAFGHETYETRGAALGLFITNVENDTHGVQFSTAGNYTGGDFVGLNLSGILNYVGGDAQGLMASSVVNINRGDTKGMQVAVVNVANTMTGVQLGIINYAEELDGHAFGVYNHIKDGNRGFGAWKDEIDMYHIGVKSGSKYSHSILAAGMSEDEELVGFSLGHGIRLYNSRWAYLDSDLYFTALFLEEQLCDDCEEDYNIIGRFRFNLGIKLHKHFALFAGVTANRLFENEDHDIDGLRENYLNDHLDSEKDNDWQGYTIGFEFM